MTAKQDAMYVAREKIYPREVSGVFQSLRKLSALVLLGLYFAVPWLAWGDRPAVLFDLPARKFYVLGMVFWPQDFIFLALLLIISALALFFVTALAGRIWCGYSCPQTVWTEIFLWIEHGIEGNRNRRQKLDRQPWSLNKLGRKTAKHLLWILFSFWTGLTFVGYFSPIHELATSLLEFNANGWEVFWVFFFTAATYGNAGYLREQVCIYMCPYARFQSAMFDRNTLIIAYDGERGEPRGRRPKSVNPATRGLGDCIDCTLCVQVCPTGIDIRNGLQYECIACAACIDACDEVMDKMQYPRGLIRYATENTMEHKPSRIVRP